MVNTIALFYFIRPVEADLLGSLYSGELTYLSWSLSSTLTFGGFAAIMTPTFIEDPPLSDVL